MTTIHITHCPDGQAISDWELDYHYKRLVKRADRSGNVIHTYTSSMVFIDRLRVAVVQDGIELFVQFGVNGSTQKVNPDGMIDDWIGSYDIRMDLLLDLIGGLTNNTTQPRI